MEILQVLAYELGVDIVEMATKTGRHWHVRKPGHVGTVELTFAEGTWYVVVRSNRKGLWTDHALSVLRSRLTSPPS